MAQPAAWEPPPTGLVSAMTSGQTKVDCGPSRGPGQERILFPREKSPWVPELSTYFLRERAGTGQRGVSLGPHLLHVTGEGRERKERMAGRRRGPTLGTRSPAPPRALAPAAAAPCSSHPRRRAASAVGGAGQGWYIQSDRGRASPVPAEEPAGPEAPRAAAGSLTGTTHSMALGSR